MKKGAEDVYWKELVFLINVQEGFTKRLAACNGPIKVFIDGPYGPSPNLSKFDSVVFVAGTPRLMFIRMTWFSRVD